jgi:hypothetical protein
VLPGWRHPAVRVGDLPATVHRTAELLVDRAATHNLHDIDEYLVHDIDDDVDDHHGAAAPAGARRRHPPQAWRQG